MTRLQKKCLIAAAGAHLLVLVAVLCSGFIRPTPKADATQVLDVIPANLVDSILNSGAKSATPPPMATPQPPSPPVQQAPPTPTPPPPAPKPPTLMERVEKILTPDKTPVDDTRPADNPTPKPPKTHKIDVDLTPVVHNVSKTTDQSAVQAAREQKRLQDQRRKAFTEAARSIKENSSSATSVEMPGSSSVSYANYASVVKSIYEQSWIDPQDAANDTSDVHISVTIASDGHVISSRIITPSGDSNMDDSVQRTLDRVTFIAPFPDGATEKERTFLIRFNLKAKRMLE
jgi:protein TonB